MQLKADRVGQCSDVTWADTVTERPGGQSHAMTRSGLFLKHSVDFVLVLFGVICLLPLFAVVAIAVKLDSPGPVFFRQRRVGRAGKLFEIFKFRTMIDGAYLMGSRLTVKRDPRITRLGAILRWSKLDELPQLFNVLRGEMSLIGPRPEDPHFVNFYTDGQRQVLTLRPGIVGPSQILGRDEVEDYPEGLKDTERYYVENILPQKLQRDLEYIAQATFWGDMKLLARGVWITARGAFRLKYLWRRRRRIALMGIDLLLAIGSYMLACVIRFDWDWRAAVYTWQVLIPIAMVRPPLLAYFGAYQGIPKYLGLWDLVALFKAVSAGSIAVAGCTYFLGWQSHSRSVFVIDWALLLFMLASTRYLLRAWTRAVSRHASHPRKKAIIVGAGSGGEQISRVLLEDPSCAFRPVGFIDEVQERWGSSIHGIKVIGGIAELRLALSANGVRTVFVCLSDLSKDTAHEVAEICAGEQIDCRMLPALSDLLNSDNCTVQRSATPAAHRIARLETQRTRS
jgi:lipopolysaccharide/colanic/teichoic acid biosynthesis glycosyltransferase